MALSRMQWKPCLITNLENRWASHMHMLVTPMRRFGVALSPQERRRYQAVKGNVMVNCESNSELGRAPMWLE